MAPNDTCWKTTLPSILSDLVSIAKSAGTMILSAHPSTSSIGSKMNSADLVTETDRAVEAMVSRLLKVKYPTFAFLGEETYQPGMKLTDAPTFIVDPIDGTTNFVHSYPYVSISLGFAVKKEAVVGVVFNPFTGLLYTGVKGRGSYVEDVEKKDSKKKLPLKEPQPLHDLSEALLAVEWGSDRSGPNWQCKIKTWNRLGGSKEEGGAMIHSARCLGSAALNLCGVAAGELDLWWEGGPWAWDVCAGWVILKEAGGVVVDGNPSTWGEEIPIDHRKYLAVRGFPEGNSQQKIVEQFWGFIEGSMDYKS